MRFDPAAIPPIWHWALLGALLIVVSKTLIVTAMMRNSGIDALVAWRTGLLLAVGGEFGLALVAIALDSGVIDAELGQIAMTSVLLSMIAGAILICFNHAIATWLAGAPRSAGQSIPDELSGAPESQVVIGGYGRVGHTIAVLLKSSKIPLVVFETDAWRVAQGQADGHPVQYGDSSDPELLAAIHVERASLVVITIDQSDMALRAVSYLRKTCPQVPVIARARDLESSSQLLDAGATHAHPEAIEASLRLGATAMQILRVPPDDIDQLVQGVRDWDYKPVLEEEPGTRS
jgi:CPA2 family monovalent cation:H+ antiporter-2